MSNGRHNNALWFIIGFFMGGLIGAVVSLLFAPEAGKKTRRRLQKVSANAQKQTTQAAHRARDAVEDLVDHGIEQIGETFKK